MNETIFENMRMYFPLLAKQVVNWRSVDFFSILLEMEDGDRIIYDDLEKTIRTLPKDVNALSKEECSREFGFRLGRLMRIKGVTQKELAERTGIHQVIISKYITGKNSPSFYNVDRIAKALGCSLDDLRYYE